MDSQCLYRIVLFLSTVFYGDNYVSLGAQNDLKQANSLAKQMVGTYGMGDSLKTFYNENTDNARGPFLGRSLATNDLLSTFYFLLLTSKSKSITLL